MMTQAIGLMAAVPFIFICAIAIASERYGMSAAISASSVVYRLGGSLLLKPDS